MGWLDSLKNKVSHAVSSIAEATKESVVSVGSAVSKAANVIKEEAKEIVNTTKETAQKVISSYEKGGVKEAAKTLVIETAKTSGFVPSKHTKTTTKTSGGGSSGSSRSSGDGSSSSSGRGYIVSGSSSSSMRSGGSSGGSKSSGGGSKPTSNDFRRLEQTLSGNQPYTPVNPKEELQQMEQNKPKIPLGLGTEYRQTFIPNPQGVEDNIINTAGNTTIYLDSAKMNPTAYNNFKNYLQTASYINQLEDNIKQIELMQSQIRENKAILEESRKKAQYIVDMVTNNPQLLEDSEWKAAYDQARYILNNYEKNKRELEDMENLLEFYRRQGIDQISNLRNQLKSMSKEFTTSLNILSKPPSTIERASYWLGKSTTEFFGKEARGTTGKSLGFLAGAIETAFTYPAEGVLALLGGASSKVKGGSFIEGAKKSLEAYSQGVAQANVTPEFRSTYHVGELFGLGMGALETGAWLLPKAMGKTVTIETGKMVFHPVGGRESSTIMTVEKGGQAVGFGGYTVEVPFTFTKATYKKFEPGFLGKLFGKKPKTELINIESVGGALGEEGRILLTAGQKGGKYELSGTQYVKLSIPKGLFSLGSETKTVKLGETGLVGGTFKVEDSISKTIAEGGFGKLEQFVSDLTMTGKGSKEVSSVRIAGITASKKLEEEIPLSRDFSIAGGSKTKYVYTGGKTDIYGNFEKLGGFGEMMEIKLKPNEPEFPATIIRGAKEGKTAKEGESLIDSLVNNLGSEAQKIETTLITNIKSAVPRVVGGRRSVLSGLVKTTTKVTEEEKGLLAGLGALGKLTSSLMVSKSRSRSDIGLNLSIGNITKALSGLFNLNLPSIKTGVSGKTKPVEVSLPTTKTITITTPKVTTITPPVPPKPPKPPIPKAPKVSPKIPNLFNVKIPKILGGGSGGSKVKRKGRRGRRSLSKVKIKALPDLMGISKDIKAFGKVIELTGKDILKLTPFAGLGKSELLKVSRKKKKTKKGKKGTKKTTRRRKTRRKR